MKHTKAIDWWYGSAIKYAKYMDDDSYRLAVAVDCMMDAIARQVQ